MGALLPILSETKGRSLKMSASQEKKRRREERADGVETKQTKRVNTAKIKKRNSIIKSVVATVVVVLIIVAIIFNSTLFTANMTALAIGEHDYSAVEFNYFYQTAYITAYSNLYSQYGEYTSYILNPSTPLEDQQYSETQSWDDYFEETALTSMQQSAMFYDAAVAEGYTLTDEEKASVDTVISNAKAAAAEMGYTFKQYLTAYYGKGFNEETFKAIVTEQTIASSYSNALIERFAAEYTEEQLLVKYETVRDDYDLISYCYYFVNGAADEEAGIDADTAMNQAYSTAKEIAAARTEEDFAALVEQYCEEDEKETFADHTAVERNNIAPSAISTYYVDWLTDPARTYGETTYGEGTNGYYVVLFVGRNDNSFKLQNFRHILVQTQTDENGEITGDAALAAQTDANNLLNEWKEDPTEDNFAAMANEHSADGGSNTTGGLYEDVVYGEVVPEIEEWLFDEARKPGDTEVVYVTSTNYSGAHILYYVGEGEQYNVTIAENLQKQEDYNAWMAEREADYEIDQKFAFRFAK